ncbi:hypothetical protein C3B58_01895 [Lactonifactor longoviformis]|nr:hypothetical protein C3B58_01895 [Lactonifactor longoviformis]
MTRLSTILTLYRRETEFLPVKNIYIMNIAADLQLKIRPLEISIKQPAIGNVIQNMLRKASKKRL